MNYEAQLDAARNAELNRYLDSLEPLLCQRYAKEQEEAEPEFTTHTFLHELNGELLRCLMTLNDQDEEDVRCRWYTLNGDLKYTNETAPFDGCDRAETLAYNTWWDLTTYERTLKAA